MGNVVRPQFERRRGFHWPSIIASFSVGIALVLAADPIVARFFPGPLPTEARQQATAPPQSIPQKFKVVDGDTVDFEATRYRLAGFNTPESGANAQCAAERTLSAKATQRLQKLLESGESYLQRVPCACAPGTEGTNRCNYGRLCGVLKVSGVDVGPTMIAEGLAEPYVCAGTRCPPRKNWCRLGR